MKHKRPTIVGKNLARIRRRRGWSQEELAGRVGIARQTITEIETGATRNPDTDTLLGLARALEVRPEELWREDQKIVDQSIKAMLESDLVRSLNLTEDETARVTQDCAGLWIGLEPTPAAIHHLILAIRMARKS